MTGQWSGGIANRTWQRPGRRTRDLPGDAERGQRLSALLAHERFWCDTCGGTHELCQLRACREANPFQTALKGS